MFIIIASWRNSTLQNYSENPGHCSVVTVYDCKYDDFSCSLLEAKKKYYVQSLSIKTLNIVDTMYNETEKPVTANALKNYI